jgi:ceramide glucosyltransferase
MVSLTHGFLLVCAAAGLACCTVFLILVILAALRFRRRQDDGTGMGDLPPQQTQMHLLGTPALQPVSLLKPLCGMEPNLELHLESFFTQSYPAFEIVFGTRNAQDPALTVVRTLQARYPQVRVKFAFSGEPNRPNAKVCSLEKMAAVASYDYLVISDSDVCVRPNYVREVVRPLADPRVGLVTCLYRGAPTRGLWSRLEALGMSVEMTSGVIVAEMLEGMRFALGPSMALRRQVLQAIGGIGQLAHYCSDDYVLGKKIFESGRLVVLSSHVIDHVALSRSLQGSISHQVRWMKSTRFSRPKGHVGTGLTFAIPFGLLGLYAGHASRHEILGLSLLVWAVVNRVILSITAGWWVVGDPLALRDCWLYPLRDLMGFCFWVASFLGTTIVWRGRRYRLLPGGTMELLAPAAPAEVPEPVTSADAHAIARSQSTTTVSSVSSAGS